MDWFPVMNLSYLYRYTVMALSVRVPDSEIPTLLSPSRLGKVDLQMPLESRLS